LVLSDNKKLKVSGEIKKNPEEKKKNVQQGKLIGDEETSHGKVERNVYLNYFKAAGGLRYFIFIIFIYTGEQIFKGTKIFR
jgi:hypothetical protein